MASAPGGFQGKLPAGLPAHGDRLTAVDASFWHREGPSSHMHLGAVMVFDGPSPTPRQAEALQDQPGATPPQHPA